MGGASWQRGTKSQGNLQSCQRSAQDSQAAQHDCGKQGTRQGRAGTIAVQANSRQQQSVANVSRQEEESSCLRAIAQLSKEAAERSWLAKAARLRCSRKRRHPVGSR